MTIYYIILVKERQSSNGWLKWLTKHLFYSAAFSGLDPKSAGGPLISARIRALMLGRFSDVM